VSEYQYYEFLAIDRPPPVDDEQAAIRSLSARARITAASFVNEYHWGDFKGDPSRLWSASTTHTCMSPTGAPTS
jgi:hypothetical protein